MDSCCCFEIKIAVLGHVSAGKTTVINALLRDKFGEVAMRRTTAGINYFRITARNSFKPAVAVASSNNPKKRARSDDTTVFEGPMYNAEDTLKEITKDNVVLRASSQVQEKTFDIEIDEELFEMRKDTKIVLVDIPGINEANASSKYKDYVAENWHTFDCVILVMDARQGVNTEEQISLLEFVKSNLRDRKDLPLIILGNKVDDPDDDEQAVLIAEARAEVEKLFQVSSREEALKSILGVQQGSSKNRAKASVPKNDLYPVFIPVSARTAFVYQVASGMDLEKFISFDEGLIEKIGREQVGKTRWKKMSKDEKYQAAYNVVVDPEHYQDGLEDSNFDKFLRVLSHCVGGRVTQQKLLEKQVRVALMLIDQDEGIMIASQLQLLYRNRKAVATQPPIQFESQGVRVSSDNPFSDTWIRYTFWKAYQKREDDAFGEFETECQALLLSNLLNELIQYYGFCERIKFSHEYAKVTNKIIALVQRQINFIVDKCVSCFRKTPFSAGPLQPTGSSICWSHLGIDEWLGVIHSVLLLSYNERFCEMFGREKIYLEEMKRRIGEITRSCPRCSAQLSSQSYSNSGYNTYGSYVTRYRCGACDITFAYPRADCNGYCDSSGNATDQGSVRVASCDYCLNKGQFAPYRSDFITQKMGLLEHVLKRDVGDEFWSTRNLLVVPKSLSDPNHLGHLCWKAFKFLDSVEKRDGLEHSRFGEGTTSSR